LELRDNPKSCSGFWDICLGDIENILLAEYKTYYFRLETNYD